MKLNLTLTPEALQVIGRFANPAVTARVVSDALELIAEDMAAQFAMATPVGVYGHAQGGWQKRELTTPVNPFKPVMIVENVQDYMFYVVNGTQPAKWNPGRHLIPWVKKKLSPSEQYRLARKAGMSEKAARNAMEKKSEKFDAYQITVAVAYAIGHGRKMKGSTGNDFPSEVIEKNRHFWNELLSTTVVKQLRNSRSLKP
jgi:hypothetical protein